MPLTDKKFILDHHEEIKQILNKHKVKRCSLGFFTNIDLQMMLDTPSATDFAQVENELQKLAIKNKTAFTINFCAFLPTGEPIFLPEDAIDFNLLKEEHDSLITDVEPYSGKENAL